jgi:hypothetical protein
MPALFSLVVSSAGLAQVAVVDKNTLHFDSLSQRSRTMLDSAPARQISYKSNTFVIADGESLNNFRLPSAEHPTFGSKLKGRKPLGRLFLVTTCSADCESKDPQFHRTVFVNVAKTAAEDDWQQAAVVDRFGLTILPDMFKNAQLEFAINGSLIHSNGAEMHLGNSSISHYYIQVFERTDPCRRYKAVYGADAFNGDNDSDSVSIDLPWHRKLPQVANGIVIGAPKVYDTYALKSLLNDTLQKMRTINPFVSGQITGAYGNLQGVSRDQSYLNVQAQVGAPVTATTSGVTDQTNTCPAGYYPAGPSACAPVTTGTSAAPITTTGTTATITPTSIIPPAPTYNPLATPGTVGQSSSDALVEQVQLSGQLQMYQLLLEGAQSDTLFVQNARAVANRAQTTIGFPVSIDPPRQFRHAVAEVRVLIEPFPTPESGETQPVSIVNLLPSQKTYNVAKITSKQHAFGGGAVIEQVATVGVSTGRAKDRVYLAKDTDTVALQYDHPSVKPLHLPFPEKAMTGLEEAVRMQRLDECNEEWFAVDGNERGEVDSKMSRNNSVLFGWQFRPVLGADYVASGPRQVFAQIALPEGMEDSTFLPAVLVQTRWREYDENRQVVGPVFHSSCTVTSIKDPVIIQNPLQVHDTTWEDLGGGELKIRTHGTFFSPGIMMQSGKNTYAPVTFDGQEIQFFAPAKDLINNGEISLVGENNKSTSITIPRGNDSGGCRIKSSSLWAIPQADGSARVRLMLEPDTKFVSELPRSRPLVLIGSDVYGLKEKPFQNGRVCDSRADHICVYHFQAQADSLRAASDYYVRDLVWSNSNLPGSIHFAPMMSGLAKYSSEKTSVTYMVSGSDLKVLAEEKPLTMRVFSADSPKGAAIAQQDLSILTDSEALLTLPRAPKGKTITIAWTPSHWPLSREAPIVWDLTLPGQEANSSIAASPSFVYSGDSRTVTYSGVDFSSVQSVKFEGSTALTFKVAADDPKSMAVTVPSAVTKEPGHKELVAATKDKKGKTGQIVLPLDVFKQ